MLVSCDEFFAPCISEASYETNPEGFDSSGHIITGMHVKYLEEEGSVPDVVVVIDMFMQGATDPGKLQDRRRVQK